MARNNLSYIQECSELQCIIRSLQETIIQVMRPVLRDDSLIPAIYEMMQSELTELDRSTAIRIELMVLLSLYDPLRLYINGARTQNLYHLDSIYAAIGISYSSGSKYKRSLLTYYKVYRQFREKVDDLYEKSLQLATK